MIKMNWFAGGAERATTAISYMDTLQHSLNDNEELALKKIIYSYSTELKEQSTSIPFILSRFNFDVSKCLVENSIELSNENKKLVKNISSLSQIRYGY